jgi:hypothetical protein
LNVAQWEIGSHASGHISGDGAAISLVYRAEQNTLCGGKPSVYAKRAGSWRNVVYRRTPATP